MKKRALIIEDNEKNRMLEKDLLEVAGFEVLEAADGKSGIDLAKRKKPDVIILDLKLPDMQGTRVAVNLRQATETRAIPIIFVTAVVSEEVVKEFQGISGALFLTKPINTRTFAGEIIRYISGGSHG